ncbi:hypothetical protein PMIN07_000873 [Paraphaeosphaeria minitans]
MDTAETAEAIRLFRFVSPLISTPIAGASHHPIAGASHHPIAGASIIPSRPSAPRVPVSPWVRPWFACLCPTPSRFTLSRRPATSPSTHPRALFDAGQDSETVAAAARW